MAMGALLAVAVVEHFVRGVQHRPEPDTPLPRSGETRSDIATVRSEVQALRADMHDSLWRSMFAVIAVMVAIGGVLLSAMAMFQG
jgi:hypothetical protein